MEPPSPPPVTIPVADADVELEEEEEEDEDIAEETRDTFDVHTLPSIKRPKVATPAGSASPKPKSPVVDAADTSVKSLGACVLLFSCGRASAGSGSRTWRCSGQCWHSHTHRSVPLPGLWPPAALPSLV